MLAKLNPKSPTNTYRLVLFCTLTDRIAFGNCTVEFPMHTDLRCNGSAITGNLRGIKNRPGTVNPPDITQHVILMSGVANKVDITFQESRASYTVLINLVEKHSVAQLVEKIRKRGAISKETVLNRSMTSLYYSHD
jgi:E3 SUMO-protein ligase PIAS1